MKKKMCICVLSVFYLLSCFAGVPLQISNGRLRMELYGDTGTFSLYYLSDPEKKRYEPLLSDLSQSRSTAFFLRIGGKSVKLQKNVNLPVISETAPPGGRLVFRIGTEAIVTEVFELVPAQHSGIADTLRIDVTVENTGPRETFTLRGVFDTILGESEGFHFSSAVRDRISSETQIEDPMSEKWIHSAGRSAAVQFLFAGSDISIPQTLIIANRERLYDAAWMPSVKPGRNFNSAYSINDSALGIYWPPKVLDTGEKMTVRMYLSADTGTTAVGGIKISPGSPVDFTLDAVVPAGVQSAVSPAAADKTDAEAPSDAGKALPDGYLITNDKLNMQYVSSLLRRIKELSAVPSAANMEEILYLSAEMDIILEKLRNR